MGSYWHGRNLIFLAANMIFTDNVPSQYKESVKVLHKDYAFSKLTWNVIIAGNEFAFHYIRHKEKVLMIKQTYLNNSTGGNICKDITSERVA